MINMVAIMPYPVHMISLVNLSQNACSPLLHSNPKKAKKKTVAKKISRQPAKQPTAVDTAFGIIKRYKKGVNIATIMQKTGYDAKKIHNLVYKLKKQGKIKSETKGVYVKV